MDAVLAKLAEHGPMGLIAVLFILLYIREVDRKNAESQARIQDAKDGLKLALEIQKGTTDTVQKLGTIFDEVRRSSK